MNTLKTVFGKLFKEETQLASHEVELGLVQDITKDLNTVSDSLTSIKPALLKIEDLLIKNSKTVEMALKAVQRVETTAKELGIDLPQEYLKSEQRAGTLIGEAQDIIDWLNKY